MLGREDRKGKILMRVQKLPPEYSKQAAKYVESSDKKTQQRLKYGIEKIPAGDIIPY